jgi:hypothetical protein
MNKTDSVIRKSSFLLIMLILSLGVAQVLFVNVANAKVTGGCDMNVTGPDTGLPIQSAIDAASPGDTICLDGDFDLGNIPLTIPEGKTGLTLTSVNRRNPARLTANADTNGIEIFENNGVTISYLVIEDARNGVITLGLNSDLTVSNNTIVAFFGLQVTGAISGTDHNNEILVSRNTITAGGMGLALIFVGDVTAVNNAIEVTSPDFSLSAGIYVSPVSDNIKISNNLLVGPNEMSGLVQYGIWFDSFIFGPGWPVMTSNFDLTRNSIAGFHSGVAVLTGNGMPVAVSDIALLKNDLTCNPDELPNGLGFYPYAISFLAWGPDDSIDQIQLSNNDTSGCPTGLIENGNVTNIRAFGKP